MITSLAGTDQYGIPTTRLLPADDYRLLYDVKSDIEIDKDELIGIPMGDAASADVAAALHGNDTLDGGAGNDVLMFGSGRMVTLCAKVSLKSGVQDGQQTQTGLSCAEPLES